MSGDIVITGRAATAIYLVLATEASRGAQVLLPANICPAAIFPVIYAGCRPVFCDVDSRSGNVTIETVLCSLDRNKEVSHAVIPHMFGNPVGDFQHMADLLLLRGVKVIEDCASALGAVTEDGVEVGGIGDYAVFSFGYSKTIDLGFGGMLVSSKREVRQFGELLGRLPVLTDEARRCEALASRLYRTILNQRVVTSFEAELLLGAAEALRPIYLVRLDSDMVAVVEDAKLQIESVIRQRRLEALAYYETFAEAVPMCKLYEYSDGAVPWRFCFFVPAEVRQRVIDALLAVNVPVSDWYPCIAKLFRDDESYPGAESFGGSVLNLPMMVGAGQVRSIATKAAEIIAPLIS